MSAPVPCNYCGAMMQPQWDGRVYSCPYCKTQQQVAIGADQIAAGMALDLANIDAFFAKLASTLHQGFHEHTKIQANGTYVMSIEIDLTPEHFVARREGSQVVAQHKKVVRGIALKTQTLALDRWVEKLTHALASHANQNARAAWVLGQLGGKR